MKTICGLLIAASGGVAPLIAAFIPKLGIGFLARTGKVTLLRRSLGLLGWLLVWQEWRFAKSFHRGLAMLPATIFAIQAQFLEPRRIFIELTDPPHQPGNRSKLANTAVILGTMINKQPHAWSYANLVPRHLINDKIGQLPVLATY